jgi:CheY-like chemotaxis protein
VILVEDDDAYRYVLARELRNCGLEVREFRMALEALEYLDGNPGIRLAVVDLRMPPNTLTGFALARMMRHRDRDACVVLMTALREYLDIPEAEPFGEILFKIPDAVAMAELIAARLGFPSTRPDQANPPP